jgi:hypothetical protein
MNMINFLVGLFSLEKNNNINIDDMKKNEQFILIFEVDEKNVNFNQKKFSLFLGKK